MELELEYEDGEFGFSWGENGQFSFIRRPDGTIKRVPDNYITTLKQVASRDVRIDSLPAESRDIIENLLDEGYLYDGPIYRLRQPDDIRLRPRAGLCILLLCFTLFVGGKAYLDILQYALEAGGIPLSLLLLGYSMLLPITALHELGHYFTSKPVVPVSVGIGVVNGILPAAITDTTESWILTRKYRIWINVAGPLVHMLVSFPILVAYLVTSNLVLGIITVMTAAGVFFALNPLYHGDGYLIVMDLLDTINIKKRGIESLKRREINRYTGYVLVSYGFAALVVLVGIVGAVIALQNFIRLFIFTGIITVCKYADLSGTELNFISENPPWAREIRQNTTPKSSDFLQTDHDDEGRTATPADIIDVNIDPDGFVFDQEPALDVGRRGMDAFEELEQEVEPAENYAELKKEMEELGLYEGHTEMDLEAEVSFEELLEVESDPSPTEGDS